MIIKINGNEYKFAGNMSVLEACRSVDVYIPTLCSYKENKGHCRLCIVQVNGKLRPACEVEIEDNMDIITESDTIQKVRASILSLIMKEHRFECPKCKKSGNCNLQDVIFEFDINTTDNFVCCDKPVAKKFLNKISYDSSKCISCGRCIKHISDFNVPNPSIFMINSLKPSKTYKDNELVSICPTAALEII